MPGIPGADIIQGGIGVTELALGLINQGKTKEEARELAATRPKYEISPLVDQDLALTRSELGNGMSDAASRAYNDLNNQQFSSAIDATLKSGGSPNSIGAIYGNSEDGRMRLATMKDNLRLQQIQNEIRASERKQQEQQTQWQVNQYAPWADKSQANAAARQGAAAQVNAGLNTLGASAISGANSIREQNQLFPTSVNNNYGFNNSGYATGVPTGNTAPTINTGGVLPIANYNFGG